VEHDALLRIGAAVDASACVLCSPPDHWHRSVVGAPRPPVHQSPRWPCWQLASHKHFPPSRWPTQGRRADQPDRLVVEGGQCGAGCHTGPPAPLLADWLAGAGTTWPITRTTAKAMWGPYPAPTLCELIHWHHAVPRVNVRRWPTRLFVIADTAWRRSALAA